MTPSGGLVLLTTSFPISGDGSEAAGSFVSDLAEEMAKHQSVRVVAPGIESTREIWSSGVAVFRYVAPSKPLSNLKPWVPGDLIALWRLLLAGETATRQAVAEGSTAHILALWALPSGHWARRVSRETGVPYSVWTLGSDIWTLGRVPIVRSYLRLVLRAARSCYSDGIMLAEETSRIGGRDVQFLPSTRRIGRVRITPQKPSPPYRLLFLGRWHTNKGVDLLIDALKLLSDEVWLRIEAVEICGGGPLEATVKRGVAELLSAGRPVELGCYLDKEAAEEAILRANYLMIPSRVESIPVVFSDAMKLGCPVLASPVGDLPSLISRDCRCGLLADAVSSSAFAQVIADATLRSPVEFQDDVAAMARRFDLKTLARRTTLECGGSRLP